jgi:hypothetical protein
MDPGHVSSFVTTNKNFFIDIIHMALLEIIIRAKLVRYNYEYLVYYVCKKQSDVLKAHLTLRRNQSLCLKHHKFSSTTQINTIYICQFQ